MHNLYRAVHLFFVYLTPFIFFTMLKTGFLLPRSSVYPAIGYDFLDGFKSYFNSANGAGTPDIVTQNIGFGTDEAEVYSKNEELLLKENVELVIAFMDGRSAEMIQPLFAATGKILLLVNMGAQFNYEAAPGACTIHHTFNVAFNSWLTGKLAGDEQHRKAAFATSYYDAGYLQCFAMATRYLENKSNAIVNNYVSHFKKDEFQVGSLEEYLAGDPETDALLSLFSGDVSPLYYKEISRLQQQRGLHIYASPMMLDENLQPLLGSDFRIANVKGYAAWNSQLANAANEQYKAEFEKYAGRPAGIFGLLGWEAGMIAKEIFRLKEEGSRGAATVKQIMEMKLDSPRGWLRFDAPTQQSYSTAYLLNVSDGFSLHIESTLEEYADEWKKYTIAKPVGESSGWRNTYLCS